MYLLGPNPVYKVDPILYLTLKYPKVLLTQVIIANSLYYT